VTNQENDPKLKKLKYVTHTITHKGITYLNAQEMKRNFPDSFRAPSRKALNNIEVGDYIKVSVDDDRFWVKVTLVDANIVYGTRDKDILLREEDAIEVPDNCILDIKKAEE
jgi:hypothetical protein